MKTLNSETSKHSKNYYNFGENPRSTSSILKEDDQKISDNQSIGDVNFGNLDMGQGVPNIEIGTPKIQARMLHTIKPEDDHTPRIGQSRQDDDEFEQINTSEMDQSYGDEYGENEIEENDFM